MENIYEKNKFDVQIKNKLYSMLLKKNSNSTAKHFMKKKRVEEVIVE